MECLTSYNGPLKLDTESYSVKAFHSVINSIGVLLVVRKQLSLLVLMAYND